MLKKVLMACLAVGVGLVTLHATAAEAGWKYLRPPGMWWYYGSVDGCATVTQVRNPAKHPALLRCDIELSEIETLCFNPNNHDVRPGVAATKVVALNTIDPEDLLNEKGQKNKGKANLCVGVDELLLPAEVLCVNNNWNPIAALTTEFTATCTTEQCTSGDPENPCAQTVVQDTQVCSCSLPAGYDINNLPDTCPDPLNPTPECVAYECFRVVDGITTGERCALE